MKWLLDSNIVSYLLRGDESVRLAYLESVQNGDDFFLSDVVDYELRRYLLLKNATRQLRRLEELTEAWIPVVLSSADWIEAARSWARLHRIGRSIDDRDLLIGVSAQKVAATLVTANTRHFEPLELPLQNWRHE